MKGLPDKSVIFAGELCDRQNLNNRVGVAEQDNGVADAGVTLFELWECILPCLQMKWTCEVSVW